jgi:hypothetical protein
VTRDDVRLFDAVVTKALGDSLEGMMTKAVVALQRGDFERLEFIDAAVRAAATLGNAAVAAQSERKSN